MYTQNEILTITVEAPVNLLKNRFADFDGSIPAAGAKTLGVVQADTNSGNQVPIMTDGIALVLSGAAVTAKAPVTTDADGKAVPIAASEAVNGYALDSAAGADELIRVVLK